MIRNFQKKQGWNKILHSRIVLGALAFLVLFFAWGIVGFIGKMQTTMENKKIAESKYIELQAQKDKLGADIAKLKTQAGVEESIRDKFGLVKDGEGEIIVVDDKNAVAPTPKKPNAFISFLKSIFD